MRSKQEIYTKVFIERMILKKQRCIVKQYEAAGILIYLTGFRPMI